MPDVESAFKLILKIFSINSIDIFLPSKSNLLFMIVSIITVLVKETTEEFYKEKIKLFNSNNIFLRWGTYIIVTVMILLCGVFDSSQFIYVSF